MKSVDLLTARAAAAVLICGALTADPSATSTESASPDDDSTKTQIIAIVNREPLYYEDMEQVLSSMHADRKFQSRSDFDVGRLVERLVEDTLLAQEAMVLGLQDEEPIPSRLARRKERLALERLEQEEIWDKALVSEEEVRAAFATEYRTATFRIITLYEREEAERLRSQMSESTDFVALVKENSVDQYSAREGLVKNVDGIDLPKPLAEVVFESRPGELIGPVQTSLGWAILRVESLTEADPDRFEDVEKGLRDLQRFRVGEELRSDLRRRLTEAHTVVIDNELIASIQSERIPDGRLQPILEDPEGVVARVGEREIRAADYGKALQSRWKGVRNQEAALAVKPMVLDKLIYDELLRLEAQRRGYGKDADIQRELRAYERELLVTQYLKEVVATGIEVTKDERLEYYNEHKLEYRRPVRVHLGQITVKTEEEANRVAGLLREGSDLAWLARQHSVDGYKDKGGDRGWTVPRPGVGDFQDALIEAESGDVLGPHGSDDTFVVIKVTAREDQGFLEFDEVSDTIGTIIASRKFEQKRDQLIATLKSRSEIEVHDDVVASLQIMGRPQQPSGPSGHVQ